MTERAVPDVDRPVSPTSAPVATPTARPAVALDPALQGRFAALAAGRILVFDHLVTRRLPHAPAAELSVRLQAHRPRGSVTIATVEGVECVAEPRLAPVIRAAGALLRPVAGAVLGQIAVDLARPLAWLDYLSSIDASRP